MDESSTVCPPSSKNRDNTSGLLNPDVGLHLLLRRMIATAQFRPAVFCMNLSAPSFISACAIFSSVPSSVQNATLAPIVKMHLADGLPNHPIVYANGDNILDVNLYEAYVEGCILGLQAGIPLDLLVVDLAALVPWQESDQYGTQRFAPAIQWMQRTTVAREQARASLRR